MTARLVESSPRTDANSTDTAVKATFWISLAMIWGIHILSSASSTVAGWHILLWFLTPYIGGVTLAAAMWLKSWWRIIVALILGVASPWILGLLVSKSAELALFLPL